VRAGFQDQRRQLCGQRGVFRIPRRLQWEVIDQQLAVKGLALHQAVDLFSLRGFGKNQQAAQRAAGTFEDALATKQVVDAHDARDAHHALDIAL